MKNSKHTQSGFTLLEILLVVAAIGILAGIVIFAINPAKQLGDTRNAQRKVDVNTIVNSIYQYSIDNNGNTPNIPTTETEICINIDSGCNGYVDLSVLTTNTKYLIAMPTDPSSYTAGDTGGGYFIIKNATTNRITVNAPDSENDIDISVTR